MNKISACLVLHNEGKNIRRCLDSLRGAVDEIIVVHDGDPEDNTLDICQSYTDKIFIRPFKGVMEEHLPFAFAQAQREWILRIDGDEFLSEGLRDNLRKLVESSQADAYSFLWPYWNGHKNIILKGLRKTALFKKSQLSFLGVVHFLAIVHGKTVNTDLILEHRPEYNNLSLKVFMSKWIAWARIQAESYFKEFKEISKFNYQGNTWPLSFKIHRHFSWLFLFFDIPFFLFKAVVSSLKDKSFFYFKYYLMIGFYRLIVDWLVFKKALLVLLKKDSRKDS